MSEFSFLGDVSLTRLALFLSLLFILHLLYVFASGSAMLMCPEVVYLTPVVSGEIQSLITDAFDNGKSKVERLNATVDVITACEPGARSDL